MLSKNESVFCLFGYVNEFFDCYTYRNNFVILVELKYIRGHKKKTKYNDNNILLQVERLEILGIPTGGRDTILSNIAEIAIPMCIIIIIIIIIILQRLVLGGLNYIILTLLFFAYYTRTW